MLGPKGSPSAANLSSILDRAAENGGRPFRACAETVKPRQSFRKSPFRNTTKRRDLGFSEIMRRVARQC